MGDSVRVGSSGFFCGLDEWMKGGWRGVKGKGIMGYCRNCYEV
jgi:hypothetical protein